MTRETRTLVESRGGIDLEVFEIEKDAVLSCHVVGRPEPLYESTYSAQDCQNESFPVGTFGLGLGAFGSSFEDCRTRFGDFLAAAGAVAHSSCHDFGVPDYLLATEEFIPKVHVLYGLKCEGAFGRLLRFNRSEGGGPIELANLIGTSLECTSCETAGFVILAECDGLVGASLKKSPAHNGNSAATRFDFPQVREWISFGGERTHRRSLAVVVGVATSRQPDSPLAQILRPLGDKQGLQGHFHAAAFPFQPLKKRSLDLVSTVTSLFGAGTIQSVLHLLNDDRPILGAGQSEFLSGAVWISPINKITSQG